MTARPDPGAGVFDTLLVQGGRPVALAAHLDRLATSVRQVYGVALDVSDLARQVRASVAATGTAVQRVRVDFVPEVGVAVDAQPLAARPRAPRHLDVRRVPGGWGAHKWRDRSLLDVEGPHRDLLLVDEDDLLLEAGRASIFVVRDSEVTTPRLDGRILPGVTREAVLRILDELGIATYAGAIALADLASATEVFVSSAIGGVRPVLTCADGAWPPGPVTRAVDEALEREWAT